MSDKYLHRGDAPFSVKVWQAIDEIVVGVAKSQLSARRLVHVEGPYGLGLKSVPCPDTTVEGKGDEATLTAGSATPVVEIQSSFTLGSRDISSFEDAGMPFNNAPVAEAAMKCASREDEMLFNGSKAVGAEGLLGAKGTQSKKLKAWTELGAAMDDLIDGVTQLDKGGFHGPYSVALAPSLYNLLFRRYAQGNMSEMQHVATLITDGVVKAPALKSGGVLVASGRQYASIVLGQDLKTGFIGPAGLGYEFTISETVALRLAVPEAVCVLQQ